VAECSAYGQINTLSKHEMRDIAWRIEARKRGPKGFEIPDGEDQMEVTITKPKQRNADDINWPDD
jgi:hypothetical protein